MEVRVHRQPMAVNLAIRMHHNQAMAVHHKRNMEIKLDMMDQPTVKVDHRVMVEHRDNPAMVGLQ